jgi:hypothetical protein
LEQQETTVDDKGGDERAPAVGEEVDERGYPQYYPGVYLLFVELSAEFAALIFWCNLALPT